MTVKELKGKVHSRQDLNRELNSLKRFSKRGSEDIITTKGGNTLSKYEYKEAKITNRIRNIKNYYKRKSLEESEKKGVYVKPSEKYKFAKREFSEEMSPKEFEKFVSGAEKAILDSNREKLLVQYKENYLNGLIRGLGDEGQQIIDLLINVKPEVLYNLSVNNPFLTISFTGSDPITKKLDSDITQSERVQQIKQQWIDPL